MKMSKKLFPSEKNGICTKYGIKRYCKNFMQNENNHLFGKAFDNEIGISYDSGLVHRNTNVLVLGGSGTGKTYNYVESNLLQANHSAVIVDVGGVLYEKCGDYLREKGYNVYCIDFVEPKNSYRFNPFINQDTKFRETAIDTFTNSFIVACKSNIKELPAYEQAVYSALSRVVFGYTLYSSLLSDEQRNFKCVQMIVNELQHLGKDNIRKYNCDNLLDNEIRFLETVPNEVFKTVVISFTVDLTAFVLSDKTVFTESENVQKFSIKDFVSNQSYLFIKTTFQGDSRVSFLTSQMFNCLRFYAEAHSTERWDLMLKSHVQFYLDEFTSLNFGNFTFALSVCRPYNIGFSIIVHSYDQLIQKYGDDWETIDANVDTHLFTGSYALCDLKYIETHIGICTMINGKHMEYGSSKLQKGMITKMPYLDTEEILKIFKNQGKIIVIVRDCYAIICDKLNPNDYKK